MSEESKHKRVGLAFGGAFAGPEVIKPVIDMLTHCPKVYDIPVVYDIFCPPSDVQDLSLFKHYSPIYRLGILEPPQNLYFTMSDVWSMNAVEITKSVMGEQPLSVHDILQDIAYNYRHEHKVDALIVAGPASQLYWDARGEEEAFLVQEVRDQKIATVFLDTEGHEHSHLAQSSFDIAASHLGGISQPLLLGHHETWQEICRVAGSVIDYKMLQKVTYGLHRPCGSLKTPQAQQFARRCLNRFAT